MTGARGRSRRGHAWSAARSRGVAALAIVIAAACGETPPQALGTLEYDRITTPSPATERIIAIDVREGDRVEAGQPLLRLDARRTAASTRAAQAEAGQREEVLAELQAGPRPEDVARARAELSAIQAEARDARSYYERIEQLEEGGAVAPADVDRARAAAESAEARARAARAALVELERGTREEQIAQGEAAAQAASAAARAQEVELGELSVIAPRDGRVDSIPFKLGDEPPVGAPLVVLLVGEAPYARIYVPEPIRANVQVGQAARVFIDGREEPFEGRVRMIRSEPTFTPYYALIGDDAARLSYLAEVDLLGEGARGLPAGLPARVELVEAQPRGSRS